MSFLYQLQLKQGDEIAVGQLVLVTDMETGYKYQTIITETKKSDSGEVVFINVMADPLPPVELN